MKKGKKLYEGKAKILYAASEKGTAIQHFKDDATAFNNQKKSNIEGKGILNNRISEHILSSLNQIGIETHLIKRINMREQLVKLVEIIPIEFVVRNIATGSLTKRLGIEDGTVLEKPLIEFCFKNDDLKKTCESIYSQLSEMKIEVLLDDRQDRLGVKLKDADLIGVPLQIIVGPKNLEEGKIEIKIRKTQDSKLHVYPQCIQDIPNILKNL